MKAQLTNEQKTQIETLYRENRERTLRSIADELGIKGINQVSKHLEKLGLRRRETADTKRIE